MTMRRLLLATTLFVACCFALNWLLQRIVLVALTLLLLATAGCVAHKTVPEPNECHEAIAGAVYQRHACVWQVI